jgi:hypothetical protein
MRPPRALTLFSISAAATTASSVVFFELDEARYEIEYFPE